MIFPYSAKKSPFIFFMKGLFAVYNSSKLEFHGSKSRRNIHPAQSIQSPAAYQYLYLINGIELGKGIDYAVKSQQLVVGIL